MLPERSIPQPNSSPSYQTRLAITAEDLRAAQSLRFEIFNRELNEGLAASWHTQLDQDPFDAVCDHLLVEHLQTGTIIGTYRMQTGMMAAKNLGYYSAQEFDFSPYEPFRVEIVELGRACVHIDHRKSSVLNMLWRGVAEYARERNCRYLLGCSSLTSQDSALGNATYAMLAEEFLPEEKFRTVPLPAYRCEDVPPMADCPKLPRLLRSYLTVGGKICGPPALDREFKTIDFLTLVDLQSMPTAVTNFLNI